MRHGSLRLAGVVLALASVLAPGPARPSPSARCTYAVSVWNARERRTSRVDEVRKARAALTAEERHPSGCTPCREDQVEVRLSNGLAFSACRLVADRLRRALEGALAEGARIESVTGYEVRRSRGEPDARGDRTRLSNHAFGVALDVNERHNGLYDRCERFGPHCRLQKGGAWSARDPLSIQPGGAVHRRLLAAGLRWGGVLPGRQKDFMHFSPTGD